MSFEPRDYLRHILVEVDYLIGESGALTLEEFMSNGTLQRAFVRSLEIMESAFEDSKPYVLTELGKQFVHYTLTEATTRLESGE